jgi:hypothetical protein
MNAFVVSRLIKHRAKLRAGARALSMPPGSFDRPLTSSDIAPEIREWPISNFAAHSGHQ